MDPSVMSKRHFQIDPQLESTHIQYRFEAGIKHRKATIDYYKKERKIDERVLLRSIHHHVRKDKDNTLFALLQVGENWSCPLFQDGPSRTGPRFWKSSGVSTVQLLVGRFVHFRIDGNLITVFIIDSFSFSGSPRSQ
jgi:hypothetical protein